MLEPVAVLAGLGRLLVPGAQLVVEDYARLGAAYLYHVFWDDGGAGIGQVFQESRVSEGSGTVRESDGASTEREKV